MNRFDILQLHVWGVEGVSCETIFSKNSTMDFLRNFTLKIFGLVWSSRVRSVAHSLLDESFWYITAICMGPRGCVMRNNFFEKLKFGFFTEFYLKNFCHLLTKSCPLCSSFFIGWIVLIYHSHFRYNSCMRCNFVYRGVSSERLAF